MGSRLTRGRSYARRGQVIDLHVDGAPADAVLDQVPRVDITVRTVPLVEVLRPAYRAGETT